MLLPTFIIAGAPQSGTTYLYELCDSHPDIFMAKSTVAEPKFYLADDRFQRGLQWYADNFFAGSENYDVRGEKTTNYLENAVVPERIHDLQPDVKLIFTFRNPISRAFSNFLRSRKYGHETLSFDEAIEQEPQRETVYPEKLKYARPHSYTSRGMYGRLLHPWLQLFPREQIHFLLMEDIESNPENTADEVFKFIGVTPMNTGFNLHHKVNVVRQPEDYISLAASGRLAELYRQPNEELAELIGRDLSHWNF